MNKNHEEMGGTVGKKRKMKRGRSLAVAGCLVRESDQQRPTTGCPEKKEMS